MNKQSAQAIDNDTNDQLALQICLGYVSPGRLSVNSFMMYILGVWAEIHELTRDTFSPACLRAEREGLVLVQPFLKLSSDSLW